jgi:hypothetical protein
MARRCATDRAKAGPVAGTSAKEHALPLCCMSACGAPEGARVPQGTSHKDFALFGAPSPSYPGRVTRRGKEATCLNPPSRFPRLARLLMRTARQNEEAPLGRLSILLF